MKRAVYHPLARIEMIEAALRYDERSVGLGGRFLTAVEAATDDLCELPELGFSHKK